MTILCDTDLLELMRNGLVSPFDPATINPASIDIRVGTEAIRETNDGLSLHQPVPPSGILVAPGETLLVSTFESFDVPNGYAMDLRLKSSIARRGWNHALAFWVDPGWRGVLTMEVTNALRYTPLVLTPGERFAQVIVHRLSGPAARPYMGRYNFSGSVQGEIR